MHFKHVDNVGGKTAFLTYSDGQPMKGCWHTSPHFDLAEGIYEGAYEDRTGRTYWSTFHTGGYDLQRQQRSLGLPAVTDVQRHTRQVFFVRDGSVGGDLRDPPCPVSERPDYTPVAWIVVDRIRCDTKHDYEVPFELYTPVDKVDWLRRKTTPIPHADNRVVIEGHTIRTDNPGFPNVALHHFASAPLSIEFDPKSHDLAHKDGLEIRAAENEWKTNRPEVRELMAFVRRTLVKWSGQGNQLLVTFIATAPWRVHGENTSFTATAPDGSTLHFAASTQPTTLRARDLTVEADTLLLVEPKAGTARGIMLGKHNAEFTLDGQLAITRQIHAPIQPVTFSPDVNVFTDHTDMTMSSVTPGVEIRYTLDGSEPGLDSPRYTTPVRLTQSSVVRAIAVRPALKNCVGRSIPASRHCRRAPCSPNNRSLPPPSFPARSRAWRGNTPRARCSPLWPTAKFFPRKKPARPQNSSTFRCTKAAARSSLATMAGSTCPPMAFTRFMYARVCESRL